MKETQLDITPLKKANEAFSRALALSGKVEKEFYEVYRAGIIQNFEFGFELCWKFIRRWLEADDPKEVDRALTKKDLFRIAHERGLIRDVEKWFVYLNARNRTSHIYDEMVAEEVFSVTLEFHLDSMFFTQELEKRV